MNKYLLYAGIIAALVFAECRALQIWRAKGYNEAKSRYEQQVLKAENARVNAVRQTEQQAAQVYAAKLQTIEQEKQNAQTANANLRRELDRLQQRITQQSRQGASVKNLPETARPSADANAAQGWVLLGECGKRYAAMAEIADGQRDKLAEWQAWGEAVDEMSE
uniref:Uncharacterized protein n=1 Tax=Myoviridae sp. ctTK08 TaxID=2826656 RepID=A0A8S5QVU6_9CAUD|nr:MAG TPA: Protein of unknown function (DUF2514) [Myoviridae sp. ctTK08]